MNHDKLSSFLIDNLRLLSDHFWSLQIFLAVPGYALRFVDWLFLTAWNPLWPQNSKWYKNVFICVEYKNILIKAVQKYLRSWKILQRICDNREFRRWNGVLTERATFFTGKQLKEWFQKGGRITSRTFRKGTAVHVAASGDTKRRCRLTVRAGQLK